MLTRPLAWINNRISLSNSVLFCLNDETDQCSSWKLHHNKQHYNRNQMFWHDRTLLFGKSAELQKSLFNAVSFFSLCFSSHVHIFGVSSERVFFCAGVKALGSGLWRLFSPVWAVLSLHCCFNPSSPLLMCPLGPCHCMFMLESPPLASQTALRSFAYKGTRIFTGKHREREKKPYVLRNQLADMIGWISLVSSCSQWNQSSVKSTLQPDKQAFTSAYGLYSQLLRQACRNISHYFSRYRH